MKGRFCIEINVGFSFFFLKEKVDFHLIFDINVNQFAILIKHIFFLQHKCLLMHKTLISFEQKS